MSDILSHIQAEWDKEDQKYESGGNSKNDDEESHVDGMNKWLVDNTDDIFNDIMKDQKKAPGYVLNPLQKAVMNLIKGLEMNPVNKGKLLFNDDDHISEFGYMSRIYPTLTKFLKQMF